MPTPIAYCGAGLTCSTMTNALLGFPPVKILISLMMKKVFIRASSRTKKQKKRCQIKPFPVSCLFSVGFQNHQLTVKGRMQISSGFFVTLSLSQIYVYGPFHKEKRYECQFKTSFFYNLFNSTVLKTSIDLLCFPQL